MSSAKKIILNLIKIIKESPLIDIIPQFAENINTINQKDINMKKLKKKADNRHFAESRKLDRNDLLRLLVVSLLLDKNSPKIITYYLKKNFPGDPSMQISQQSIYKWINNQKKFHPLFTCLSQ